MKHFLLLWFDIWTPRYSRYTYVVRFVCFILHVVFYFPTTFCCAKVALCTYLVHEQYVHTDYLLPRSRTSFDTRSHFFKELFEEFAMVFIVCYYYRLLLLFLLSLSFASLLFSLLILIFLRVLVVVTVVCLLAYLIFWLIVLRHALRVKE